jgi:hypothetical protein
LPQEPRCRGLQDDAGEIASQKLAREWKPSAHQNNRSRSSAYLFMNSRIERIDHRQSED